MIVQQQTGKHRTVSNSQLGKKRTRLGYNSGHCIQEHLNADEFGKYKGGEDGQTANAFAVNSIENETRCTDETRGAIVRTLQTVRIRT